MLKLKAKLVLMLIVVKLDIAITELATTEQVIEPDFEFSSLKSTQATVAIKSQAACIESNQITPNLMAIKLNFVDIEANLEELKHNLNKHLVDNQFKLTLALASTFA